MNSMAEVMRGGLPEKMDTALVSGPSTWCQSRGKRLFDFVCASLLLASAAPIMALMAVFVALTSRGPVLFRQLRVGKNGREFTLFKYRTMTHAPRDSGPGVTRKGDSRITALGRILRRCKLDELPQLLNVIRGDMSLVGPRPDLVEYLHDLTPQLAVVLLLRPGVTGPSSLKFVNEEELLARVPQEHLITYYTSKLLPRKIELDLEYARNATFCSDMRILIRTINRVIRNSVMVP